MVWTTVIFVLSIVSIGNCYWQPTPLTNWTWQLQGTINTTKKVVMYDIDLFDAPVDTIKTLKQAGKTVICYFSAGSFENWRPDNNSFPDIVKGKPLDGWPGERWLDIRRMDILGPIMSQRMDLAKTKGCDGLEPDNVDAYENDSGFNLTSSNQISYNTWLAQQAHARDLSVGLKNDLDQVKQLLDHFDWALNEQCWQYKECDALEPFIKANKAVFNCEYKTFEKCPQSIQFQMSSIQATMALDGKNMKMCNLQGQLVPF